MRALEEAHKRRVASRRFDVHIRAYTCTIGILQCRCWEMWATACDVARHGRANVGSADNSKRLVMRGLCLSMLAAKAVPIATDGLYRQYQLHSLSPFQISVLRLIPLPCQNRKETAASMTFPTSPRLNCSLHLPDHFCFPVMVLSCRAAFSLLHFSIFVNPLPYITSLARDPI